MLLVLYSFRCRVWKIADFGLMSEATTMALIPTKEARGRDGYRAPELLFDPKFRFNNKADIWSLGCILYELCVGDKAFPSDFAAREFSLEKKLKHVVIPTVNGPIYDRLQHLISETLDPDPQNRPSAKSLRNHFVELAELLIESEGEMNEYSYEFSETDIVVGIDFGTTYSGVAYAVHSSAKKEALVVRTWPGNGWTEKVPTLLAYTTDPPKWGYKVKHDDESRIAHFKLGLRENLLKHYFKNATPAPLSLSSYLADQNWRHPALPSKRAVDYTADYLKSVVEFIRRETLPRHFGLEFEQRQKVSYIITVPAIWSDTAKELTRTAAVMAGIPLSNLLLLTEPEAAAQYCIKNCKEVDLKVGDKFLICDAGGGTVVPIFLTTD